MLIRYLAIIVCLASFAHGAVVTDFSDIQYWVGSGTNEAAMVIQWNDGKSPVSLAWGFKWDGVATGWDMIQAIAAADPQLSIDFLVDPHFGHGVYGIFYDVNGDRSTYTPGTIGDFPGPDQPGILTDATDHYQIGWSSGYWGYFISQGDAYPGTGSTADWAFSDFGVDGTLTNQAWNAFNFSSDVSGLPPDMETPIAAVPEPRTLALICLSAGVLVWRFRKASWHTHLQQS